MNRVGALDQARAKGVVPRSECLATSHDHRIDFDRTCRRLPEKRRGSCLLTLPIGRPLLPRAHRKCIRYSRLAASTMIRSGIAPPPLRPQAARVQSESQPTLLSQAVFERTLSEQ